MDQRAVSLDTPAFGDDDGASRGDSLVHPEMASPETSASGGEMQDILQRTFLAFRETLNERERAIWDRRLQTDDPEKLQDLGDAFGVSKERIRQLENRIKARLKAYLEQELGDDVIVQALH